MSSVKPRLIRVVNSHKIIKARQVTFTASCLQRLKAFFENSSELAGPDEFLLSPNEILLPDFVCEVRLGPSSSSTDTRVVLILADCLILLANTNSQVANDLCKWVDQCMVNQDWQTLIPDLSPYLTLCLQHFTIELINSYSIRLDSSYLSVEFTPICYNPQSLFEALCASKELDLACLFHNLKSENKPNYLGLESPSRHVSQASLLSQVPLSNSPCSANFFKKKFDSLWGYFNFKNPIIEHSKMFYGAISNPDLESNLYVTRKSTKSKKSKMWTVLKGQSIFMFKKRSSACNAMMEVNLENFNEMEVLEDNNNAATCGTSTALPLTCNIGTFCLKFTNSKKCVFLTPLDRFDYKRWEETLNTALRFDRKQSIAVGNMNSLQARRISGLSNSFHNLSSTNNSRNGSPTFSRKVKLTLPTSRGSREMMSSCSNLDQLGSGSSCCKKYHHPPANCSPPDNKKIQGNAPIITIDFTTDSESGDAIADPYGIPVYPDLHGSTDSLDKLTPEELSELRRRRHSTVMQLECLQTEVNKRKEHLSASQMQALNNQMSDLYEDIRDMDVTLAVSDKKKPVNNKFT